MVSIRDILPRENSNAHVITYMMHLARTSPDHFKWRMANVRLGI